MTEQCLKDRHFSLISTPLSIGKVTFPNRVALAPMSGVTDLPFRKLAYEFGTGFVVTEMVASRELVQNSAESWSRLKKAAISPHIVQLAGRDPHFMAEGARIAEGNGADVIDINMGCPAKKVIGGLSGSALMREPELALSIIEATVKAVNIPVTLKMRLGWDDESINAPELAHCAEDLGIQMVTVHGRTRMQFYEGRADWKKIALVRERVSIPLVANGDVQSAGDIAVILENSGADAVMIGRGAQGRPWHTAVLAGAMKAPSPDEVFPIFEQHYRMMIEFYGGLAGVRHARKHVGWYLDRAGAELSPDQKTELFTTSDPEIVVSRMRDHLALAATRQQQMREAA